MSITLDKIDLLRERTGVSYAEAKRVLEEADGDVVDALVLLEERNLGGWQEELTVRGSELVDRVRRLVREASVTSVKVLRNGEVILEIPATVGILSTVVMPSLTVIGTIAAMMSEVSIIVEREEDSDTGYEHTNGSTSRSRGESEGRGSSSSSETRGSRF